jgi:hypothetical protein
MNKTFPALAAAVVALALSAPAASHHSGAMFDQSRTVTLVGTVAEFEWTSPHVWIRINVPQSSGQVENWGVESFNPMSLSRQGWKANSFKPGDKVELKVHPSKDGRPFAQFVGAKLNDGTILGHMDAAQ